MHHRMSFNLLIIFINIYLFRYPLFLNLENHCSNKQQALVARLLLDVFGGKVYI
jgi:hypothetical protein